MLLFLLGCHDAPLPDRWELAADAITVEVRSAPYGWTVRDGSGADVLSTLAEEDGYSPASWTSGKVYWDTINTPGYFSFITGFGDWRDELVVVEAIEGEGSLELVLAAPDDVNKRGKLEKDAPTVHVMHTIRAGALRVEATIEGEAPRAWSVGFPSPADEAFIGFGERFNRTDQRGVPVYSWAEEGGIGGGEDDLASPTNPYPNGQAMSFFPIPFFVSTAGYGFWLDTDYRSQFELATERDDAWRAWHIGPEMAFEVYVGDPADSRPWPLQAVDRFTEAVGRPMEPPPWAFGPRRRVGRGSMVGEVREIQAMRDEDLAITAVDDAVHFLPKGSHVGIESELAQWTADAGALGYRVNGYYNPYLAELDTSPLKDEVQRGLDEGWFIQNADGEATRGWLISGDPVTILTIDMTNPEAKAWYQGMFRWALDLGYSGWMQDFGEYVQPGDIAADGTPGEAYHNRFPVLYDQAVHEALEGSDHAGDWLGFARSGYTGSSHFVPMVWTGDPAASFEDADGLPSVVRAGINLGIAGVPFTGSDIGGFHCIADGYSAADAELWTRWIQQGAMTANMQDQNACVGALGDGEKDSIWTAPEAKEAWRTYARLHTRMQPYFRTLAKEAVATGAPVMRHVFLEFPDRPDLGGVEDAYLLGPAIYVAPVVERGAVTKAVDLPGGLWLDWRDGSVVSGAVTLDAPLAEIPLLLRDGYLVPLLDPSIDTLSEEANVDVIGPTDVEDVYDVVGFLSTGTAQAHSTLFDGTALQVGWTGSFAAPADSFEVAAEELSDCAACWRADDLGNGVTRVRITSSAGEVLAGGLQLRAVSSRTIRWDLYLQE